MKKQDPHVHNHTALELLRITKVQPKYAGSAGDRSFVMRVCECGDKQAFEYGDTKKMQALVSDMELKAKTPPQSNIKPSKAEAKD